MSDIQASTYNGGTAVTPSDTLPISGTAAAPKIYAGFYVGATGGNVTIITPLGETVLYAGTIVGWWYPFALTQVKATGTNATSIVALEAAPFSGSRRFS